MKSKIRTMWSFLVLVTVALGMVSGKVGISYAITNGQPDGDDHPYVGAVIAPPSPYFCSGVAISEYIFVTCAHCFDISEGNMVLVTFDPEPSPDGNPVLIPGTWHPHHDFCLGCGPGLPGFDTHDVAVVVLYWGADLPEYAELPEEGLVDMLPIGTDVDLVGYGAQGFFVGYGPPEPYYFYERYYASSKLIASKHAHSDEYIKLTANPAQGKGGDCFGDSGGPNLLGGTNIILALTTYGANPMCTGIGYSNRLDTEYALEFINSFFP